LPSGRKLCDWLDPAAIRACGDHRRQCGSSQQAVHSRHSRDVGPPQDVVVAWASKSMTRVPMGSNVSLYAKRDLGEGPFSATGSEARFAQEFSARLSAQRCRAKAWLLPAELATPDALERPPLQRRREMAGPFDAEIFRCPSTAGMHTRWTKVYPR